jgi:hypothetical protein
MKKTVKIIEDLEKGVLFEEDFFDKMPDKEEIAEDEPEVVNSE